jgi:glycosyltransferase involved in cell wall biosynthesis
MANVDALIEAIQVLADDAELRNRIASGGHQVFRERLATPAIANQLGSVIADALAGAGANATRSLP